ncbi:MAG: transglycosylase SLT domain-containing protein [Candidatus Aminicenantes bacterium]|nr:MAG: transglycosylase SLT domain-containing protein [Candidatus Aminicenantes bacterium]
MLKSKLLSLILGIAVIFSACLTRGGDRDIRTINTDINAPVKDPPPPHLARAESNFQKGKELVLAGDIDGAKYYFDRVINILLDTDTESKNLNHRTHLEYYLEKISGIELSYLEDRFSLSESLEAHEAFLDEVISTPLFPSSEHEIRQIRENMDLQGPQYTIPITINSQVVSFIKAFRTIRKKNIQDALNRSVEYIDEFKRIFRGEGLPEDLAYLPLIESGFRVHAVSRARARGVWQFMASTARMFGLRVDWVVDERRDPYKSAAAAAKYLKKLYEEFGDWYLALACYNGGTRRVNRAIKRLKTKDFFKIARHRWYIRRETRNYVPAFLAALVIAKNPETYGFTIEKEKEEKIFANTKTIQIPSPVNLDQVAALAKIPYRELQKINPELIREFTPFNKNLYSIRVPKTVDESTLAQLKRLPPAKKYFIGWYKVKRGDSLYSIARKFNTSVKKIKKANKLRSNLIHPGKRLLIPRGI